MKTKGAVCQCKHVHNTGGMVPFPKDCVRVKYLYVPARTQEKGIVSESQQQHNRRKVKIVFPTGESNIISGDRGCQFTI